MPPPRVVFVVSPFGWGGTEKHLEDLIARLHPGRIEATIVACAPNDYAGALLKKGVRGVAVHPAAASTISEYRRVFRTLVPDAVVFVNGALAVFPWKAYVAARMSGAKRVIGIEHSRGPEPPPPEARRGVLGPVRWVLGWRARHMMSLRSIGYLCHRTICVSEGVRRTLVEGYGYPSDRTVVILNGIDLKYFRPSGVTKGAAKGKLGIPPTAPVMVTVAGLGSLKRIDVLLRAVSLLKERRPSLRCLIVGGGPLAETLCAQSAALGLDRTVEFRGHHEDIRPFLEAADVYVSTSDREGFGLAVVEAMAMQIPCVATDIGGHDEILSKSGTGLLVPAGDPEAVASGVEDLLEHAAEAEAMGVAARTEAEARFNIDRMVAQILDVLMEAR